MVKLFEKLAAKNGNLSSPKRLGTVSDNLHFNWPKVNDLKANFETKIVTEKCKVEPAILNDEKKVENEISSSSLISSEKSSNIVTTIDENLKDPDHYVHDTSKSELNENKLENDEKNLECEFSSNKLILFDEIVPSMVTTIDKNLKDSDHRLHDTSKSDLGEMKNASGDENYEKNNENIDIDERLPQDYDPLYDNEVLFRGKYSKLKPNNYEGPLEISSDLKRNKLDENMMKSNSMIKLDNSIENSDHSDRFSPLKSPQKVGIIDALNTQSDLPATIVRLPNPVKMPKIGDGFSSLVHENRVRRKRIKKKEVSKGQVSSIARFFEKKPPIKGPQEKRKRSPEIEEKKRLRLEATTKDWEAD